MFDAGLTHQSQTMPFPGRVLMDQFSRPCGRVGKVGKSIQAGPRIKQGKQPGRPLVRLIPLGCGHHGVQVTNPSCPVSLPGFCFVQQVAKPRLGKSGVVRDGREPLPISVVLDQLKEPKATPGPRFATGERSIGKQPFDRKAVRGLRTL